ncbi:MAG: BMC domain-containing protein [Elusimicrobia bacterium]|nr:BMC domain-containing protein [Elusimicrobiota bacterium]
MLANYAVGLLEVSSIAKGIEAADAMCKVASVTLVKTSVIARGKYTILISGPVGEVESSLRAGTEIAKDTVIHHFIIRNVHQQVLDTLEKRKPVEVLDALGIIETKEAIAAVQAADAAAKAANVRLLETKVSAGGGKGFVTMTGEVGAVRSAVAAGIAAVPKGMLVTHVIIPQADKQLLAAVGR